MKRHFLLLSLVLVLSYAWLYSQDEPFNPPELKPLTPREEQMTFRLPKGFKIELAACEPEVVDPVALAFDEKGRLFVAEMIGYPNEGVGTGTIYSGRIRLLEDKDGDGFFETSSVFADKLRLPTGVMPWRGGVIVCNAPQIIFFEDTKGKGKADRSTVLYEGFDLANIQQMVNSLTWGLDNYVYGVCGSKGGTITSPQKKDFSTVSLRGAGIRFHPEIPGSLQTTSGGGQYGLTQNAWGDWFVNTNSQHLRHVVLPDHYLARNPQLAVGAVTLDISDHGPACKVNRISPFESWRVERTRRRKGGADSKRFASNELVPGGFVTSGCSPLVYQADLFPPEYVGNTFMCDPANNLIHQDRLEPKGATYVAHRVHENQEFLSSTDNWFRPVHITTGPDGAIYVADFYREVIETPLSLPEDMKNKLKLQTRERGRIWRITQDGAKKEKMPNFAAMTAAELAQQLESASIWRRTTAQRLLYERQDKSVVPALESIASTSKNPTSRIHALWTLQGLGSLSAQHVLPALSDADPLVKVQALPLAEAFVNEDPKILDAVVKRAEDESAKVRFQAAFSLGEVKKNVPEVMAGLAKILRKDAEDTWTQTALLSSISGKAPALLEQCFADIALRETSVPAQRAFLNKLAQLVGSSAKEEELASILLALVPADGKIGAWQVQMLEGISLGLFQAGRPLDGLWEKPSPTLEKAITKLAPLFQEAGQVAQDDKAASADRVAAVRLLGFGPKKDALQRLPSLWAPQQPQDIQMAAVRALTTVNDASVPSLLLESWTSFGPGVRREALEGLLSSKARIKVLLKAIQDKKIEANQIEPARLELLRKHPDAAIRAEAVKLLASAIAPNRQKVVEEYRTWLDKPGEVEKGRAVFKKICSACHRLENVGVEVGADLMSTLPNKTPEQLLVDILDPSREVDSRFLQYVVTLTNGRVATGLIATEAAGSVTLRRAEKQEETILRNQIDTIQSTAKSLMPEGLEMQIAPQDFADLLSYLQSVGRKKN